MHPQRRSGRIAKELDILLLGTDASGKVFSEKTKTVVLSRHGAGIVSRYRFSPDETLTHRLAGSSKEAEVRLVGQIGGEPGRYVYGLAFLDPQLEFWPMEFPPPEPFEAAPRRTTLECSFCGGREAVEQMEVEEDVYTVNESILRFCKSCGNSTPWKKSRGEAIEPPPTPLPVADAVALPAIAPRASAPSPNLEPRAPSIPAPSAPVASAYSKASGSDLVTVAASSSYSASALEILPASSPEFASAISLPAAPAEEASPESTESSPPVRAVDANGRRVNRRKHTRVRVNFHACVRQGESGDDIVECENVSKGGLSFRSRRQYAVDSVIDIAAPYKEGEPALFVSARIRRSERLGNGDVFRYGAAYVPGKANGSSR